MNKSLHIFALLFLSLLSLPLFALDEGVSIERSATLSTVRESSTKKTEDSARRWGLTTDEWQKYEEIMRGEGRYNWTNADPVTVLGIYSETDAERERYAERVALREKALVKRFLAFNFAYLNAAKRLHGNEPVIDMSKFYAFYDTTQTGHRDKSFNNKPIGDTLGDRFVLFISPGCNGCDTSYHSLRRAQTFGTGLDIYFVGASDQDIMDWAKKMAIDPERVKSGSVTLNGESGMYARYNRPPLPAAFYYRKATQSVHPVNLEDGSMQ